MGALVETVTTWEDGRTRATTTDQPSGLVPFKQADARRSVTFDYRYAPRVARWVDSPDG